MKHWLLWATCAMSVFAGEGLVGTWRGEIPGEQGPGPFVLIIENQEGNTIRGRFHSFEHHGQLSGTLGEKGLDAAIDFGGGVVFYGVLAFDGQAFKGEVHSEALNLRFPLEAGRSEIAGLAAIGLETVDFSQPIPGKVYRSDLPKALTAAVVNRIERHRQENGIVGLATAVLYDGQIADLRVFGWEDYPARAPVSDKTMFRWASISKPLTAVVAMQLMQAGRLDLDRDVREYVPEFPRKPWSVTSRQLLTHRAGLVHYHPGKVIVTKRQYTVDHPFADRILALDKFKESALLFQPGTDFSYSTPGYALLGAVIQRAGKADYAEQVRKGVLAPLGMTSMQPDYPQNAIPHRTMGYEQVMPGVTIPSGDSDVSWKLAAGGWISNIGDLARFAGGILNRQLIPRETWEAMWSKPVEGKDGTQYYAYGFNVTRIQGARTVFHSGAQSKTATMMMLCPEERLGLVIMANTEGVRHESVSTDLLKILLPR